jgi:outer membrane protein OmpA-like peptidoglycan-associated protein
MIGTINIRKGILILVCFLLGTSLFSQQSSKKILRIASEEANGAYEEQEYEIALKNYLIMDSLSSDDPILSYRIGVCQRETFRFDEAISSFNDTREFGYTHNDLNLMVAKTYHLAHEFEKGEIEYQKYYDGLDSLELNYKELQEECHRWIVQCQVGARLKETAFEITLQHLDTHINTPYAEYAPLISADESVLMYTSRKPTAENNKADLNGLYHEHIYSSRRIDEEWSHSYKIDRINKTSNDACVGLSPDGTHLILYRTNNIIGEAGDLYISKLKLVKGTVDSTYWSVPRSLGTNINSTSWEPSASLSEDNQTLYFTSNRPGGYGGTDIYVSHKVNGHWGKAINLGPSVNTKFDEDSPYINKDVLYFSSKGHQGMGGYDLFMSVNFFDEWLEPINFGYPINSAKDDFHFVWNHNGTSGYFSSVRKDSYGKSDIYVVIRPFENPEMIYVKGTMTDELSEDIISNAHITLTDSMGSVVSEYNTDSLGRYKLAAEMGESYHVEVQSDDYATVEYDIHIPKKSYYFELTENIQTITKQEDQKRKVHDQVVVVEEVEQTKGATVVTEKHEIDTVYFDYNEFSLSVKAISNLNKQIAFLQESTNKIKVSGHTDKVGSNSYNDQLAKKRATSVILYLKSKGINSSRFVEVSAGKRKPISTDAGKNRRVEISLL